MPPGTLHLAIVQPGLNHANIKGIDTSEAEAMPGVVKVITAKDIKGTNRIMFPLAHARAKFDGIDRPIIADEKVFRYGDVVAVVAAHTQHEAREAARKVKLDLEELPAYMTYLEAVAPGAAEIHPGVPNMYVVMPLLKGDDTREVLAGSEHVVEGSWYTTSQPHMVMEPDVTQAYMDEEGRVTVHNKTLAQVLSLLMLGPALGLPEGKIRVIENFVGGELRLLALAGQHRPRGGLHPGARRRPGHPHDDLRAAQRVHRQAGRHVLQRAHGLRRRRQDHRLRVRHRLRPRRLLGDGGRPRLQGDPLRRLQLQHPARPRHGSLRRLQPDLRRALPFLRQLAGAHAVGVDRRHAGAQGRHRPVRVPLAQHRPSG